MIELHPTIVNKDGRPESVVLPYEEFVKVRDALTLFETTLAPGDPRYGRYWDNLTVEELARRQGVSAVIDLSELAWPFGADDWDGFDETVELWRKSDMVR